MRFGAQLCVGRLGVTGRDLSRIYPFTIFLLCRPKIFVSLDLPRVDMSRCRQNLEPQALMARIFRNKDLASDSRPLRGTVVANWLGEPSACSELALPGMLSKGCSSHELRFLLWRAVEKGKVGVDGIRLGAPSAPVVPTPRKNFGLYWCGSTTVGSASIEKWFSGVANGQDECSIVPFPRQKGNLK